MNEVLKVDENNKPVVGFVTDDADELIRMGRIDDASKGLKVTIVGGSGMGTVTSIAGSTGILLTPDPITTTGTVGLATNIAPIATLGTAGQSIRVNAGATALEYYTVAGGGNVSNTGTPLNNQVAVWTNDTTIEGTTGLTYDGANFQLTGDIGSTGTRITKGWFTDLQVTNAIAGSITGTAAVATTVTVANEATDTSCFLAFVTDATGNLGVKSNANMTFNSNTGVVTLASSILTTTDINGGTIDGTVIGGAAAAAATITTLIITSFGGNWTNAGRTVADLGIVTTVDINGGTIDGTVIGGASAAAGTFTTISGTTITASTGFALGDGDYVGVTSNERFVFNTAGTIVVTGADLRLGETAGTDTTSVVSVGGTQTLTAKTLTAPVINASTMTGNFNYAAVPTVDHTANGITISAFNLGATIALMDLVYLGSSSKWLLTDADAAATAGGVLLGICLDGGVDTDTTTVCLQGLVRDDTWNWTPGAVLYVDTTTPGQIIATQPSGTDDVIRVVGFAVTADVIYFNASPDYITHT